MTIRSNNTAQSLINMNKIGLGTRSFVHYYAFWFSYAYVFPFLKKLWFKNTEYDKFLNRKQRDLFDSWLSDRIAHVMVNDLEWAPTSRMPIQYTDSYFLYYSGYRRKINLASLIHYDTFVDSKFLKRQTKQFIDDYNRDNKKRAN